MLNLETELKQLRLEMRQLRQENAWLRNAWERQKEQTAVFAQRVKDLERDLKLVRDEKDAEIHCLKEQLKDKEQQRQALLKILYKPEKVTEEAQREPKKPREGVFLRPIPSQDAVTQRHLFSLTHCPDCHGRVGEAVDTVVKYEEDITLAPLPRVVEYTMTRHWCGRCRKFVKRRDIPVIRHIGIQTMGYILYARYRLGLPLGKIQSSLRELYAFTMSEGGIVEQLHAAEGVFGKDYKAIAELIREGSVIHADETGWRVMGEQWWLWVFTTPQGETRFILEDTRGQGVAKEALGEKEDRVINSDFYAAYWKLPGQHQYCWIHLMREAKEVSETLATQLQEQYGFIKTELKKELKARDPTPFKRALEDITLTTYPEETKAVTTLQERIHRFQDELLTCLNYDGVAPDNNHAERTIRPQVIMRKIFGGCRSLKGAQTHAVNSSIITSYRARNPSLGFFETFLPLIQLRSAQSRE